MVNFQHLEEVKQSYVEHFLSAMYFCYKAEKACIFFFLHAIYPDIFVCSGSIEIDDLYNLLRKKNRIH